MRIYVVVGSTGEYSDRNEWIVRAHRSEDAAKATVLKLDELGRVAKLKKDEDNDGDGTYWDDPEAWLKRVAPELMAADPGFQTSYTGTIYTYETTELEDC